MTKQKFRKRLLATLLSLLALLAFGFGGSYLYYSTGHQAEDPKSLASIQGLNNAEDMVQLGDSQWVLTGNLGDKSWEKGGLYMIDAKTMTWEEAEIDFSATPAAGYETIEEPELFSAHGIAMKQLDDTSFEIYAVNHGGRESVEVFDLSIAGDKPQIRWKGSVPTPDGMVGNSVAPLSDGFLVTIPMIETDAGTFTDFLAGKDTGTVYKWTAEAGYQELPQARLAGNNGIAVSPDEQWAFINGYSDKTVTRISLVDDKAKPVTVPVSFLPDNIRYSSDGSLLVTGQDTHILTVVLLTNGTDIGVSPSDTAVAELDPDTMTVTEVLDLPTFRAFGGGTTALYVGDDLWVSSFRAQRIMVVPDAK